MQYLIASPILKAMQFLFKFIVSNESKLGSMVGELYTLFWTLESSVVASASNAILRIALGEPTA